MNAADRLSALAVVVEAFAEERLERLGCHRYDHRERTNRRCAFQHGLPPLSSVADRPNDARSPSPLFLRPTLSKGGGPDVTDTACAVCLDVLLYAQQVSTGTSDLISTSSVRASSSTRTHLCRAESSYTTRLRSAVWLMRLRRRGYRLRILTDDEARGRFF
jgi:hypothetical protein